MPVSLEPAFFIYMLSQKHILLAYFNIVFVVITENGIYNESVMLCPDMGREVFI